MESIITALITGGLTLIGTVMTVSSGQRVPVIEEQVKVINHRIADLEEGK